MSLKSRLAAIEKILPKQNTEIPKLYDPEVRTKLLNKYKGLIGEERFNMMVKEFNRIPSHDDEKKLELIRKYYREV